MNVERLHTLCIQVNDDIAATGLESIFTQLVQSLTNYASNPAPQYQQAFSNAIQAMYEALEKSELNDLNPVWVQLLQELYGYEVTGDRLKKNIMNIVGRNNLTPAIALNELNSLYDQFSSFNTGVKQVVEGLTALKIGTDDLEGDKCELGILIPRKAVNFHLRDFGIETERLDKILSPFTELTTGSRDGHELRTIASSDFLLNVILWAVTAKVVAEAIVELMGAYLAVVKVREVASTLKDTNANKETLDSVESHANAIMGGKIDVLVEQVIEHGGESITTERKNELRTEVKISLKRIANRIDQGYHFEVRVPPLIEENDAENISDEDEALNQKLNEINELAKQLDYHKVEGEPILRLEVEEDS